MATDASTGSTRYDVDKYTATGCVVVVPNKEVLCTTAPGVGGNLTWRVEVAGQASLSKCLDYPTTTPPPMGQTTSTTRLPCFKNLTVTTSYARPVVRALNGGAAVTGAGAVGAATVGGQVFVVAGEHFGPTRGEANPVVTYGPADDITRYTVRLGLHGEKDAEGCVEASCFFFFIADSVFSHYHGTEDNIVFLLKRTGLFVFRRPSVASSAWRSARSRARRRRGWATGTTSK